MAFTGSTEDRLAIREVYGMYSDSSATQSIDTWTACWAEDAVWQTSHFTCNGIDEIRAQWQAIWAGFDKVAVLCEVCAIEVNGDEATGRSIAREIVVLKGGGIFKLVGLYTDKFVRRNGQWRFLRREYSAIVDEPPAS